MANMAVNSVSDSAVGGTTATTAFSSIRSRSVYPSADAPAGMSANASRIRVVSSSPKSDCNGLPLIGNVPWGAVAHIMPEDDGTVNVASYPLNPYASPRRYICTGLEHGLATHGEHPESIAVVSKSAIKHDVSYFQNWLKLPEFAQQKLIADEG